MGSTLKCPHPFQLLHCRRLRMVIHGLQLTAEWIFSIHQYQRKAVLHSCSKSTNKCFSLTSCISWVFLMNFRSHKKCGTFISNFFFIFWEFYAWVLYSYCFYPSLTPAMWPLLLKFKTSLQLLRSHTYPHTSYHTACSSLLRGGSCEIAPIHVGTWLPTPLFLQHALESLATVRAEEAAHNTSVPIFLN